MHLIRSLKAIYHGVLSWYNVYVYPYCAIFGYKAKSANISTPAILIGTKNMYLNENVDIGPDSIIFAPRSKVIIKKNSYTGPRLFISTGNHYSKAGVFSRFINDDDKQLDNVSLNWDVIIEEDVWIGANVTILCKKIGRGSIIAAGAVVKEDVPPYSVVAGVPAKVVKMKFAWEDILKHERTLYQINERIDIDELKRIYYNGNK